MLTQSTGEVKHLYFSAFIWYESEYNDHVHAVANMIYNLRQCVKYPSPSQTDGEGVVPDLIEIWTRLTNQLKEAGFTNLEYANQTYIENNISKEILKFIKSYEFTDAEFQAMGLGSDRTDAIELELEISSNASIQLLTCLMKPNAKESAISILSKYMDLSAEGGNLYKIIKVYSSLINVPLYIEIESNEMFDDENNRPYKVTEILVHCSTEAFNFYNRYVQDKDVMAVIS
jgi:hypothetical protein